MGAALDIRSDLASPARLRALARRERSPRTATRMLAIASALEGRSRAEAAHHSVMERQALHDAVVRYKAEGLEGLRDRPKPGRPAALTEAEQVVDPADILRWFVRHWRTETTFEEARRHLGVETQRQWSDQAIRAHHAGAARLVLPRGTERGPPLEYVRWYRKSLPTFSDALALVRRELWAAQFSPTSPPTGTAPNVPPDLIERLLLIACRPP